MPLFLHPADPPGKDRTGEYELTVVAGYLFDSTINILRMICSNFLDRYRAPKLICVHTGAYSLMLRKRMQRDFSVMLATLLDARMPEPDAVTLAAGCTANSAFQARAAEAVNALKQGRSLTDAMRAMDDSGEFQWRLTNATHSRSGFLAALSGWHDALNAKSFQLEQAAAHVVSTALVLLNGLFVACVVISVFSFLISIVNAGALW